MELNERGRRLMAAIRRAERQKKVRELQAKVNELAPLVYALYPRAEKAELRIVHRRRKRRDPE
jgi:hypothetical protein